MGNDQNLFCDISREVVVLALRDHPGVAESTVNGVIGVTHTSLGPSGLIDQYSRHLGRYRRNIGSTVTRCFQKLNIAVVRQPKHLIDTILFGTQINPIFSSCDTFKDPVASRNNLLCVGEIG